MPGSARDRMRFGRTALLVAVAIMAATVLPGAAFAASPVTSSSAPTGPASAPAVIELASTRKLTIAPQELVLGNQRVGTFFYGKSAIITNTGSLPIAMDAILFSSGNKFDFVVGTDCFAQGHPTILTHGASCLIQVVFTPRDFGLRTATLSIVDSAPGSPQKVTLTGYGTEGYYLAGPRGGVAQFGDAVWHGDRRNRPLSAPMISMTTTTSGAGYWLLGSDGGVFAFGNARFSGSTGAMRLNRPVVGMAAARGRNGYWLVASDGGIFTFGKVRFFGSTGAMHLNQPIVGMAATRSGRGYWLVARDGGIFTFGDARFLGSTGALRLAQPIVAMAPTPSGRGYWLLARDGGIFAFGDARFFGSLAGRSIGTAVGIAPTPQGAGYWISNAAGQVFTFGDAGYFGDLYRKGIPDALGVVATAPGVRAKMRSGVIEEPTESALGARIAAVARQRSSS